MHWLAKSCAVPTGWQMPGCHHVLASLGITCGLVVCACGIHICTVANQAISCQQMQQMASNNQECRDCSSSSCTQGPADAQLGSQLRHDRRGRMQSTSGYGISSSSSSAGCVSDSANPASVESFVRYHKQREPGVPATLKLCSGCKLGRTLILHQRSTRRNHHTNLICCALLSTWLASQA
jgi:hypothetical protein